MAEKKAYVCLLIRGAKPISFYCIHENLFRYIFTHSVIPLGSNKIKQNFQTDNISNFKRRRKISKTLFLFLL